MSLFALLSYLALVASGFFLGVFFCYLWHAGVGYHLWMEDPSLVKDVTEEEDEETRAKRRRTRVHKIICNAQWQVVSGRLGDLETLPASYHDTNRSVGSFGSSSSNEPTTGRISLATTYRFTRNDEPVQVFPLDLLPENRLRLEALGFRISADNLWAVYESPKEPNVSESQ